LHLRRLLDREVRQLSEVHGATDEGVGGRPVGAGVPQTTRVAARLKDRGGVLALLAEAETTGRDVQTGVPVV
jgi:hypothetical protein